MGQSAGTIDVCRGSSLSFSPSPDQYVHVKKLPEEGEKKKKEKKYLKEREGTVLGIHRGPGILPSVRMGNLTNHGVLGAVLRRASPVEKN